MKNRIIKRKNIGTTDKRIRFGLAILIGVLYYTEAITGNWAIIFLVILVLLMATSLFSFCPIYNLFNMQTRTNSNYINPKE